MLANAKKLHALGVAGTRGNPVPVRVSEVFLSIQGEGPSAGTPAHFLRLQGCDVGCAWCDSKYTWDAAGGRETTLAEVWREAEKLGEAPMIVVTGGEPLEHPGIDAVLSEAITRWPRVEVETSGIVPPPLTHTRLYYNVSPKLPSATSRWEDTWHAIDRWKAEPRATFKIVVGDSPDDERALELIRRHDLPRDRVMLMPEGMTDVILRQRAATLARVCMREGLRLGPRLHVWMWGARRGM